MDYITQTPSPPSDQNDLTYSDVPPPAGSVKTRPSTKSATQFSTATRVSCASTNAKEALTRLAPDGERCILSLHSDPLECCHLVPRRTDVKKQRLIEAAWGMEPGKFYFHAPQNIFWCKFLETTPESLRDQISAPVKTDLHKTFDHYKWYLVPTEEDLQKVIDFNDGKRTSSHFLTEFPQATWEYHFLPAPNCDVAVTRYSYEPSGKRSYKTYMPPYTDFPILRSQVHLFYVIYNVGEKVYDTLNPKFNPEGYYRLPEDPSYRPLLEKCKTLYLSWVGSSLGTPDITTQPPSRSGPSTSRSDNQSQNEERTRRLQHRNKNKDTQARNSPRSGSGTGAPQGRNCTGTTETTDQYLPTPEQSIHSADRQPEAVSGTRKLARHWANLSDWVASVGSCASNLGPQSEREGAEQAKQSLVEYRHEAAREPPPGSWEKWSPEYGF